MTHWVSVCHCFYIPMYCMSLSEVISVFFGKAVCCNKTLLFIGFRLAVVKTLHAPAHGFGRCSHNISLRHLTCLYLLGFAFVRILMLWKWASYHFCIIGLALFVWGRWMFFSEQGQVLLLSLQPISVKARGHHYISASVRHSQSDFYSKTATTSISWFLHQSNFWRHFKQNFSPAVMPPILLNCMGNDHNEYIK